MKSNQIDLKEIIVTHIRVADKTQGDDIFSNTFTATT